MELINEGIKVNGLFYKRVKKGDVPVPKSELRVEIEVEEKKKEIPIEDDTFIEIEKYRYSIPFLRTLISDGAGDSFLKVNFLDDKKVFHAEDLCHKVFTYKSFLKDQRLQLEFMNEYGVMRQA